jgi:uncharacterized protein YecA (UPF0149 family)
MSANLNKPEEYRNELLLAFYDQWLTFIDITSFEKPNLEIIENIKSKMEKIANEYSTLFLTDILTDLNVIIEADRNVFIELYNKLDEYLQIAMNLNEVDVIQGLSDEMRNITDRCFEETDEPLFYNTDEDASLK